MEKIVAIVLVDVFLYQMMEMQLQLVQRTDLHLYQVMQVFIKISQVCGRK